MLSESGIRNYIQRNFSNDVVWIENATGGTSGLPDCLYFPQNNILPSTVGIELKSHKKKLRASQKMLARKFIRIGVPYIVVRPETSTMLRVYRILDVDDKKFAYIEIAHISGLFGAILSLIHHNLDGKKIHFGSSLKSRVNFPI